MNYVDHFIRLYRDMEDENTLSPIIQHGNVTFAYVKYRDLFSILTVDKIFIGEGDAASDARFSLIDQIFLDLRFFP